MLDKGPLYATGGSSSHAPGPGLPHQPVEDDAGARRLHGGQVHGPRPRRGHGDAAGGHPRVARNEPRLRELQRRWNATAWGFGAGSVEPAEISPSVADHRHRRARGRYVTEGEGLAVLRAVEAQARSRDRRGARFVGDTEVTGIEHRDGRVTGVAWAARSSPRTWWSVAPAYGTTVASMVDSRCRCWRSSISTSSRLPVAELAANARNEATMPIAPPRARGCTTATTATASGSGRSTIGAAAGGGHRPRHPRAPEDGIVYAFTPEGLRRTLELTRADARPARDHAGAQLQRVFAFTPRRVPAIGEHPDLRGFWWVSRCGSRTRPVSDACSPNDHRWRAVDRCSPRTCRVSSARNSSRRCSRRGATIPTGRVRRAPSRRAIRARETSASPVRTRQRNWARRSSTPRRGSVRDGTRRTPAWWMPPRSARATSGAHATGRRSRSPSTWLSGARRLFDMTA